MASIQTLRPNPFQILDGEDPAKIGVMIRHYNNKELSDYVRVFVGKPQQTNVPESFVDDKVDNSMPVLGLLPLLEAEA
ncbi:hypothetical protein LguiB_025911 [Lonicera macranthoides]